MKRGRDLNGEDVTSPAIARRPGRRGALGASQKTASAGRTSRYVELSKQLHGVIQKSGPDTLLPPEEELAKHFSVSRSTMRRALAILQRSGLISRTRGRGTVVSAPKYVRTLFPACTIEEDFARQGLTIDTTIVGLSKADASSRMHVHMEVKRNQRIAILEMQRSFGSDVICFERRSILAAHAEMLDRQLIGVVSLSELLEHVSGASIANSEIETEILPAQQDVADYLGITAGSLVLIQSFKERTTAGKVLQFGMMFYRIDRVRFKMLQSGAPFRRDIGARKQAVLFKTKEAQAKS